MKYLWNIPDMFWANCDDSQFYVSHESICVLNTTNEDADIYITLYYEDADPAAYPPVKCNANRTHHIRMDKLLDTSGNNIRRAVPYAGTVSSDVALSVQYSRLDVTQPNCTLMTTMVAPAN